jgi:predicted MPP superfamily phosphohydrolase/dolichol kinase
MKAFADRHRTLDRLLKCIVAVNIFLACLCLVHRSFFSIRLLYDFNTLIVPCLIVASAIVGYWKWNSRPYERDILRVSTLCLLAGLCLLGIRIYATHIEPYDLKLRTVTIYSDKVVKPFRILHMSDIQTDKVGKYEEDVFKLANDVCPDLILCTGDFVQTRSVEAAKPEFDKLVGLFNATNPPYGTWAVLGDVDWRLRSILGGHPPAKLAERESDVSADVASEDPPLLHADGFLPYYINGIRTLQPGGQFDVGYLHILENKSISLVTDAGTFDILGLSNPLSKDDKSAGGVISGWLANTDTNAFRIVLGHSPDYVLSAQNLPIDLCLAGHTHGGQIRLPFIGPLVTLSKVPRNLARGYHDVGRTHLNVSAGIGSEHADGIPPIRIHCPPEMTLIELVPSSRAQSALQAPLQGGETRSAEWAGVMPTMCTLSRLQDSAESRSQSGHYTEDPMSSECSGGSMSRFLRVLQETSMFARSRDFLTTNIPSWRTMVVGGPIGLLWAYCCLFFAGYLKRCKGLRTGYTRKTFHFLIFTTVAMIHSLRGTPAVCLFGGMTTLVVFYAVLRGDGNILYEAMAREKDAPHRTHFIIVPYFATLIGGLASNILFGPLALFGYLVAGLGDAIGEPVGTMFGKHTYRVPSFGNVRAFRSYEGSASVYVVSILAITLAVASMHLTLARPYLFVAIGLIALASALVEAVSPHGWDNASMQIIPSWLASLFLIG